MTVDDTLHITGGSPLYGTVPVRGSKNAVPKLMVAALLTDQPVTIRNVSFVRDIGIVADLVEELGSTTTSDPGEGVVTITARDVHLAGQGELAVFHERSRIPVLTCAPLLHRTGQAEIWRPGGCSIGERPVGFHLDVLPAIPDVEYPSTGILLTDVELREWQHSNPIGYATWFRNRSEELQSLLAEAAAKRSSRASCSQRYSALARPTNEKASSEHHAAGTWR